MLMWCLRRLLLEARVATYHIDTTVTRNSNDAVERTHINAHNRHVYTGARGIGKWKEGVSNGGGKKRGFV